MNLLIPVHFLHSIVFCICHTEIPTMSVHSWFVVLGFNATLTAKVISWRLMTHMCFLAYSVLTQLFFPKPPTTFLTCFCRGEGRKYAGKKSRLNWRSNSQPLGHESDTLTTEPTGRCMSVHRQ